VCCWITSRAPGCDLTPRSLTSSAPQVLGRGTSRQHGQAALWAQLASSPLPKTSIAQRGSSCGGASGPEATLDEAVSRHIMQMLKRASGKVEGPGGAAELLAVHPRTLQNRMKKLGIPFGRKAKELYAKGA
jgi:transcriptional regulator with GAF, ATPase, and Fis domain